MAARAARAAVVSALMALSSICLLERHITTFAGEYDGNGMLNKCGYKSASLLSHK